MYKIALPRSKSIVIRCLMVHYLRTGKLLPVFDNDPNDILIVYNALKMIDANKNPPHYTSCQTIIKNHNSAYIIDVQDCGAAYRFLMPILATTKGKWLLTGTPHLLQRPILPLVTYLNEQGAQIEKQETGWLIEGREFQVYNFEIDTSETSQFVSALMMAGNKDITRNVSATESPYINMTQTVLQTSNLATSKFLNYADWSAAVFWLANALLIRNAHYLLKDLHFDKLQGDAEIVAWFKQWGLSFTENEQGIEVYHFQHIDIREQTIDLVLTPDIAMVLATLSVCYPFQLKLCGVKNLNIKESNRLDFLIEELSKFTIIKKQSENEITIYKRIDKLPECFHFNSYNDHRFVMAWSLFKNFGKVIIENAECVKKSYPNFGNAALCLY